MLNLQPPKEKEFCFWAGSLGPLAELSQAHPWDSAPGILLLAWHPEESHEIPPARLTDTGDVSAPQTILEASAI